MVNHSNEITISDVYRHSWSFLMLIDFYLQLFHMVWEKEVKCSWKKLRYLQMWNSVVFLFLISHLSSIRMSLPSSNWFPLLGRKKESCYSIKNGWIAFLLFHFMGNVHSDFLSLLHLKYFSPIKSSKQFYSDCKHIYSYNSVLEASFPQLQTWNH